MNTVSSAPRRTGPGVLALALLLGGCGGSAPVVSIDPPKPPPPTQLAMTQLAMTQVAMETNASSKLNVNTDGTAAPLLVRVYELTDSGRFMGSGFFALFEDDRATLGADLVARDEIRFAPGENRVIEKTLNPATKSLGVLGAYRSTDQRRWRASVPILPEKVNRLRLDLGARELTLTPEL